MVDLQGPRMPPKGEVKRRGEPPLGGGIKAAFPTRLGRSTGSGTDAAGPTTWQPKRRDRCGGSRLFLLDGAIRLGGRRRTRGRRGIVARPIPFTRIGVESPDRRQR